MENNEQANAPLIDASVVAGITGEAVVAEEAQTETTQTYKPKGPDKTGFYWGTGRRKSSVARVRIKPGSGTIAINKKEVDEFFARPEDRKSVVAPLEAIDGMGKFDIFVNVQGGGSTGQAGAVMLGLARALREYDINLLNILRQTGYLTRDGRMKERKKPGQRGARRKFQFSKR